MLKKKAISKINPKFLCGIAHRGLHNEEFTENGMKAFENAINNDFAFELDVHLTKDKEVVVCHDENLVRTTGKEGIIEDLTLAEIRENYHLHDGGNIPTLKEVLEFTKERVPVVVELKVYKRNYKELAKYTLEVLKKVKDPSNIMLISFDPRSLWSAHKSPYVNSFLVAKSHFYTYKYRKLCHSVDLEKCLFEDAKIQKYCKKHFTNVWTVETIEDFDKVYPYVDTVTFQHMDINYVKEKLTEKNKKYLK